MAAFDAPRTSDRPLAAAGRVLAAQPGTFVAAVAAAALMIGSTFLLMASAQWVVERLEYARAGIQMSIYLDPGLARSDALALKSRLDALPIVRSAVLRSRDDALIALADAGLPSLRDRPNPLPDVWIVTLATGAAERPDETLAAKATEARNVLAALPGVETVRLDLRWVELLDRWSTVVRTGLNVATWGGLIVLSAGLFCVFCLTGRALRPERPTATAVVGLIGALCGMLGLVVGASIAALAFETMKYSGLVWKPTGDLLGQIADSNGLLTVGCIATGVATVGLLAGNRDDRRKLLRSTSAQF